MKNQLENRYKKKWYNVIYRKIKKIKKTEGNRIEWKRHVECYVTVGLGEMRNKTRDMGAFLVH